MGNEAKKQNENTDAWLGLLWLVFGIPYAVMLCAVWAVFRPFKQAISNGLGLKRISASWRNEPGAFRAALYLFGFFATICTVMVYYLVSTLKGSWQAAFGTFAFWTLIGFGSGFIHLILWWVKQYHADPIIQRTLAGQRAERIVAQAINRYGQSIPSSAALHNTLMVFNHGLENEFSAEADHILVTDCQIYLFETKYKSGTVFVEPAAATWQIQKTDGTNETMRNPLLQVKNTARILRTQFGLPFPIIPIVVFVGETMVVGTVGNVIIVDNLDVTLDSFEKTARAAGSGAQVDPGAVCRTILAASADPTGPEMEKHKVRAQSARMMYEAQQLVKSASLN